MHVNIDLVVELHCGICGTIESTGEELLGSVFGPRSDEFEGLHSPLESSRLASSSTSWDFVVIRPRFLRGLRWCCGFELSDLLALLVLGERHLLLKVSRSVPALVQNVHVG